MSELNEHRFCECDEILREYRPLSNEIRPYYLKSEANRYIAHQKYKRCLAMADALTWEHNYLIDFVSSDYPNVRFKRNHRLKWMQKWLKLAEKFKEEK